MLNQNIDLEGIVALGRALSNPKRVAILDLLMQGVQCNCELAAALGVGESLISHHMRLLEDTGLVQAEHDELDARWVYYAVAKSAMVEALQALDSFLDVERIQARQPSCGPSAPQALGCC